jgi:hypothetical protein
MEYDLVFEGGGAKGVAFAEPCKHSAPQPYLAAYWNFCWLYAACLIAMIQLIRNPAVLIRR